MKVVADPIGCGTLGVWHMRGWSRKVLRGKVHTNVSNKGYGIILKSIKLE